VIACKDLDEALQRSATAPDLVLADYHLDHGASGIDALDALQARWVQPVPGVVITADHTPQARQAALDRGYASCPSQWPSPGCAH
jgi:CheY-like chemotaxis protein